MLEICQRLGGVVVSKLYFHDYEEVQYTQDEGLQEAFYCHLVVSVAAMMI